MQEALYASREAGTDSRAISFYSIAQRGSGASKKHKRLIMKYLFRFLCVVLMLCYSINGFSETARLWVGDSYTFALVTSGTEAFGRTWSLSSYEWEYYNSSDQQYFSLTPSTPNRSTAVVELKQIFSGTKRIIVSYTKTVRNSNGTTYSETQGSTTFYIECNKVSVSLYPTSLNLNMGDSQTLQWQFSPASSNPAATVSFSSSNTGVATVDFYGKVTAVGAGSATITATTNYWTTATCQVTVNPMLATSISLNQTSMYLPIGSSQNLTATVLPASASDKTVTWTSSEESVATVDANGHVTGVATGLATITATTNDGSNLSASCAVTVTQVTASSILLDKTELEMNIGETYKLTATVLPSGASQRVTWSSSDPNVARVVGGTVYAQEMGECLITARTLDGTNLTADCLIMVYPGGETPSPAGSGDVNGDGVVNIEDVTSLIDYLLYGTTPITPPVGTKTYTVGGVSFTMVDVEGGTFTMGATPEQGDEATNNEKPAHQVTLSSYSIGQTEVTQALWLAVMGTNPSAFTGNLQNPVEMVSWDDCQEFITRLNALTGKSFRLPTEAEWEYAARGGNKSQGNKYAGSSILDVVGWYADNSDNTTHPVATKSPNELGLYDMSGNVYEQCQDWWYEDYSYISGEQINPTGPTTGTKRVMRGGAHRMDSNRCRVSRRGYITPTNSCNYAGLRLAL